MAATKKAPAKKAAAKSAVKTGVNSLKPIGKNVAVTYVDKTKTQRSGKVKGYEDKANGRWYTVKRDDGLRDAIVRAQNLTRA